MALQQEMTLSNWLNVTLYWKVIFYDFRAGVITLGWFASEESEAEWKAPIETFKYSHATEEYRYETQYDEIEIEASDNSYIDETIIDTFQIEKQDEETGTVIVDMKRVLVPNWKTKKIKNEDYIWKTGYLLIKLYRFLKEQNEFVDADDA